MQFFVHISQQKNPSAFCPWPFWTSLLGFWMTLRNPLQRISPRIEPISKFRFKGNCKNKFQTSENFFHAFRVWDKIGGWLFYHERCVLAFWLVRTQTINHWFGHTTYDGNIGHPRHEGEDLTWTPSFCHSPKERVQRVPCHSQFLPSFGNLVFRHTSVPKDLPSMTPSAASKARAPACESAKRWDGSSTDCAENCGIPPLQHQ